MSMLLKVPKATVSFSGVWLSFRTCPSKQIAEGKWCYAMLTFVQVFSRVRIIYHNLHTCLSKCLLNSFYIMYDIWLIDAICLKVNVKSLLKSKCLSLTLYISLHVPQCSMCCFFAKSNLSTFSLHTSHHGDD